jgi:hypothetical protein
MAVPGHEYLFYTRYGGSVKLDLSSFPESQRFSFQWTDLVSSSKSLEGTVAGGRIVEIKCPEDYPGFVNFKDWILHVWTIGGNTGVTGMKTQLAKLILLPALLHLNNILAGQNTVTINGVVTAFEKYPLNNVSIRSLETGNTAKSDSSGQFSLDCAGNDILIFNAAGFLEQKVRLKKFKPIYLNLKYAFGENSFEDAVKNNHISERALENALSQYHSRGQRNFSNYTSIYDIIQSEFSTLKVVGTEVHTSKTTSIYLSQQVLYVVDGMIVSDISYISPADVVKIEFVDDASAAEYGMRGANGILKIALRKSL